MSWVRSVVWALGVVFGAILLGAVAVAPFVGVVLGIALLTDHLTDTVAAGIALGGGLTLTFLALVLGTARWAHRRGSP